MVQGFDRIVVEVADLPDAAQQYARFLGVSPYQLTRVEGLKEQVWFGLANTVIQLQSSDSGENRIRGLVFSTPEGAAAPKKYTNPLGLELALCDGSATARFREEQSQAADLLVDHLVLRTSDATACVALFSEKLGIRLALDKTVPEWGGRMLFFRAGKLTLEVIESQKKPAAGNTFWGIAYQCRDIERSSQRLGQAGVALSGIRDGRKPGTRVATLKSHDLGIPSLLIEPVT